MDGWKTLKGPTVHEPGCGSPGYWHHGGYCLPKLTLPSPVRTIAPFQPAYRTGLMGIVGHVGNEPFVLYDLEMLNMTALERMEYAAEKAVLAERRRVSLKKEPVVDDDPLVPMPREKRCTFCGRRRSHSFTCGGCGA